jgi:hypothetical protein
MMICNHCGTENVDGATFCKVCGHELISREESGARPARKRRRPALRTVLITFVLVATAIVAISAFALSQGRGQKQEREQAQAPVEESTEVHVSSKLYYTKPEANHIVTDQKTGVMFVNNELIVYLEPSASHHDAEYLVTRYGGEIAGSSVYTNSYLVRFTNTYTYADLLDLSERLQDESLVKAVSRNTAMVLYVDAKTQDPAWAEDEQSTWGLRAIKAAEAWDLVRSDSSIKVGVLDGQIYTDHEDLDGVVDDSLPGFDSSATFKDDKRVAHATHVAGIIAAQANEKGSVGVAYGSTLYGYSALANSMPISNKRNATLAYDLEVGLTYLVAEKGCRVINVSLNADEQLARGIAANASDAPQATPQLKENSTAAENMIRALIDTGYDNFVICKSAGNRGDQGGLANYDCLGFIEAKDVKSRIIMVASASRNEDGKIVLSDYTNVGDRVDVVAPGDRIYNATCNTSHQMFGEPTTTSSYENLSGTSMATSFTSGVAALVVAANPDLTGDQIKTIVCNNTSKDTFTVAKKHEVGLLNARDAVAKAQDMEAGKDDKYDPGVSLGALNTSLTSDGTYLYAVVENNADSYAAPFPSIVRIDAKTDKTKVVWKGTPVLMDGVPISPIIEPSKDGLFVLVPGLDWSSIHGLRTFFVPSDNKAIKELDFGNNVEWSPDGKPFLVYNDQLVYATVYRGRSTYWEIHSCDHNGSSDALIGSGYIVGGVPTTGPVVLLGVIDKCVYFSAIHQEGENRWVEVFALPIDGKGEATSILRTAPARGSSSNVCLVDDQFYTVERNELVRYDLDGLIEAQDITDAVEPTRVTSEDEDSTQIRTVVASVEGANTVALWNITDSVAYVYSQDTYPATTWKINLKSSSTRRPNTATQVSISYPTFGYASLELAGDDAYTVTSSIGKVDPSSPDVITLWP